MSRLASRIRYYVRLLFNRKTPWYVRLLLSIGLMYLLIPMDFIPDSVPLLGLLDDVTIGTILVTLAIKLMPKDLL